MQHRNRALRRRSSAPTRCNRLLGGDMLIGLHGFPGSGKDTVAELLGGYGYERIAFADKLREALLGLNPVVLVEGGRGIRLAPLVRAHGWDRIKRSVPE